MVTFNNNITQQTISGASKFVSPQTWAFLKNCVKGECDAKVFKSCVGMTAKSIDTAFVVLGVIILGIKNKQQSPNVKEALSKSKPTLNNFFHLLYSGNGIKMCAYLKTTAGGWFHDLFNAVVVDDDKLYEKLLKNVYSIRLNPQKKKNQESLNALKNSILSVCPGVDFDEAFSSEESDSLSVLRGEREKNNEDEIVKKLFSTKAGGLLSKDLKPGFGIKVICNPGHAAWWEEFKKAGYKYKGVQYDELYKDDQNVVYFCNPSKNCFRVLIEKFFVLNINKIVDKIVSEIKGIFSEPEVGQRAKDVLAFFVRFGGNREDLKLFDFDSTAQAKDKGFRELKLNDKDLSADGVIWFKPGRGRVQQFAIIKNACFDVGPKEISDKISYAISLIKREQASAEKREEKPKEQTTTRGRSRSLADYLPGNRLEPTKRPRSHSVGGTADKRSRLLRGLSGIFSRKNRSESVPPTSHVHGIESEAEPKLPDVVDLDLSRVDEQAKRK